MGYRQKMTDTERLKWDIMQHNSRKEARIGKSFQYWNDKHRDMVENKGYSLYTFNKKETGHYDKFITGSLILAKEAVEKLREEGNIASIVCGIIKNIQRVTNYSVIYKPKKNRK